MKRSILRTLSVCALAVTSIATLAFGAIGGPEPALPGPVASFSASIGPVSPPARRFDFEPEVIELNALPPELVFEPHVLRVRKPRRAKRSRASGSERHPSIARMLDDFMAEHRCSD